MIKVRAGVVIFSIAESVQKSYLCQNFFIKKLLSYDFIINLRRELARFHKEN